MTTQTFRYPKISGALWGFVDYADNQLKYYHYTVDAKITMTLKRFVLPTPVLDNDDVYGVVRRSVESSEPNGVLFYPTGSEPLISLTANLDGGYVLDTPNHKFTSKTGKFVFRGYLPATGFVTNTVTDTLTNAIKSTLALVFPEFEPTIELTLDATIPNLDRINQQATIKVMGPIPDSSIRYKQLPFLSRVIHVLWDSQTPDAVNAEITQRLKDTWDNRFVYLSADGVTRDRFAYVSESMGEYALEFRTGAPGSTKAITNGFPSINLLADAIYADLRPILDAHNVGPVVVSDGIAEFNLASPTGQQTAPITAKTTPGMI